MNKKRFNFVIWFLFLFFIAWTILAGIWAHYNSWLLTVVMLAPFFISLLFLNLIFSAFYTIDTLFLVYPLMDITAKIFGLDFDRFRQEVIDYGNAETMKEIKNQKAQNKKYKSSEVLILLPHCIQNSECIYKVTWDKLDNCRLCGKCSVPQFLELQKKYGLKVVIVSGGTAAREIVRSNNPQFIIAVACENDLISGLRDVRKIPIVAVLNQRLFGPCRDTTVDIKAIMSYLDRVLE